MAVVPSPALSIPSVCLFLTFFSLWIGNSISLFFHTYLCFKIKKEKNALIKFRCRPLGRFPSFLSINFLSHNFMCYFMCYWSVFNSSAGSTLYSLWFGRFITLFFSHTIILSSHFIYINYFRLRIKWKKPPKKASEKSIRKTKVWEKKS